MTVVILLLSVLSISTGSVYAQTTEVSGPIMVPNPSTGLWRDVRERNPDELRNPDIRNVPPHVLIQDLWQNMSGSETGVRASTRAPGVNSAELINYRGEQWRNFRMQQLVPFAAWLLAAAAIGIVLFRVLRGQIKIRNGRSGVKIPRFNPVQRTAHWAVAITFVLLGLTGTILLFGRFALIPIIGAKAFGYLAIAAKRIHDFAGPVFGVALVAQFMFFVRGNFLSPKTDIKWLLNGGGLLKGHASSHCYNLGEKSWFWLAMLGGAVVVATGLVLDFPVFVQDRTILGFAHVIHSIGALTILAASLGHIYIGTIGMEGSFETMSTGYCDSNWAKEHHDLWYEHMLREGKVGTEFEHSGGSEASATSTTRDV